MALHTIDPSRTTIIFGPHILSGFDEDTYISIAYDGKLWETHKGADGEFTRVKKVARLATATITLGQASDSNLLLAAVYAADLVDNDGVLPFMVKDDAGELVSCAQAYIEQEPDLENGSTTKMRAWKITLPGAVFTRLPVTA